MTLSLRPTQIPPSGETVARGEQPELCPECGEPLVFTPAHKVDIGTHGMPGLHTRDVPAALTCPDCGHTEAPDEQE